MNIYEAGSTQPLRRLLCQISSGSSGDCAETPSEVRLYSSTTPNGSIVNGWEYDTVQKKLFLPFQVEEGQIVAAFSSGRYLFQDSFIISGISTFQTIYSTLILIDQQYNLREIKIDITGPMLTSANIKWIDGNTLRSFPRNISYLARNVPLLTHIVVTYNGEDIGNYRDYWINITAYRCGVNL